MFVLRKIKEDGREMNFSLGENYGVVTKERTEEEFNKILEKFGDKEETYGFVIDDQANILPLYRKQKNFIMGINGKTFANLSV